MKRAPAAARWAGYVGIAIVFAVACAFLSQWQFDRNTERAGQLALVERNYDSPAVPFADVVAPGGDLAASDEWQPVTLTGEYLSDDQLLVRNRPHGGTAAFEVLVPFRLDDGRVVVVNRGWVRPGVDQPEPDAVPAAPSGEVTVIARVRPGEPLPSSGRSAPGGQVPTISVPLIAEAVSPDTASALVPDVYATMVSEDPAPSTAPSALEAPTEDPGPHLSYAIQWILFAIMGFIFIGYVIRTEIRARREDAEDDQQTDAAARRPAASPRRHDRDADDEDALLDATR
ncbi:SURF1 family protein [Planococcus sp. APC 4015]|nr:SURF1 family protein [Planococcus sp. APC 4015]